MGSKKLQTVSQLVLEHQTIRNCNLLYFSIVSLLRISDYFISYGILLFNFLCTKCVGVNLVFMFLTTWIAALLKAVILALHYSAAWIMFIVFSTDCFHLYNYMYWHLQGKARSRSSCHRWTQAASHLGRRTLSSQQLDGCSCSQSPSPPLRHKPHYLTKTKR